MLNLFIVFSIVISWVVGFWLGKDSQDNKIFDLEHQLGDLEENIKELKEEKKRLLNDRNIKKINY